MPTRDPYRFERDVADIYRRLGCEVQHDVSLAGSQIDVVVTERGRSGSTIVRLVECKAYSSPVGIDQVRTFAAVSGLLRERHLADAATMVAENGYTRPAREAADEFHVELLEYADLKARLQSASDQAGEALHGSPVQSTVPTAGSETVERADDQLRAFVAIPFTPSYDDVYLLGILAAAEDASVTVERADDNLDSSEIIEYIKARISASDLVIVDTTEQNANVFYELGYADGLGTPVLLLAAAGAELPFDLRGRNHLLYTNITQLRERLAERLARYVGG